MGEAKRKKNARADRMRQLVSEHAAARAAFARATTDELRGAAVRSALRIEGALTILREMGTPIPAAHAEVLDDR